MNWEDKQSVRKGNVGERLVAKYLRDKGFVVYRPTHGPHPFDNLVAKPDKSGIFVAEVKAKGRRKNYPDTGIDYRHFQDYQRISMQHSMDVFLFFVDHVARAVYGNRLSHLIEPIRGEYRGRMLQYPRQEKTSGAHIVYFPLARMVKIADLESEDCAELSRLTTGYYNENGQERLL